jgi:glycosyltransferase involved in cell wall biosynthesis
LAVVSVLMPVYNSRKYLREAVGSILAQTFRDFELIVVDDGSTDESPGILAEFAEADARVRVISRPNTGIVGALNDALAAAGGELVARMDADDVAMPERFEKQVAFLRENPQYVLVGSQVMLIDPEGAALCPKRDTQYTHEKIDQGHLEGRWPLVHPTVMVRRAAMVQVGGYRSKYQFLEDTDLFLRLAEVGKLASLQDILLRYRLHPGSICHTREKDQDRIRPELEAEVFGRRGMAQPKAHGMPISRTGGLLDGPGERFKLWGWWALNGGNVPTARRYALRALGAAPLAPESWRLMYCALRGR